MRVAVLGASGSVGRRIVSRLLDHGHTVAAQTRDESRLADLSRRVAIHAFDPTDAAGYPGFLEEAEAVVFALGAPAGRRTTLFSDTTRVLLEAMTAAGVRRLVAITGVGAGETRGHGGLLYDRIVFPLFTRPLYADKERQEALIAESDCDWTIVRPAPFAKAPGKGPLQIVTELPPPVTLRRITRDEVAGFIVDAIETGAYLHARPFIGHR